LRNLAEQRPIVFFKKIEEIRESLYDELYEKIFVLKNNFTKNQDGFTGFSKFFILTRIFSLPKIIKFVTRSFIPSLLFDKEKCFDEKYFFSVVDACLCIVNKLNLLSNLSIEEKTTSSDIFNLHTELNKIMQKYEIFGISFKIMNFFKNNHSFNQDGYASNCFQNLCLRFPAQKNVTFLVKCFKILFSSLIQLFKVKRSFFILIKRNLFFRSIYPKCRN
jgi:hypothetical protein